MFVILINHRQIGRQVMQEKFKQEEKEIVELEPICLFIIRNTIKGLDEEDTRDAVDTFLADFKIFRTPNPFIWFFLGRWKPEISRYNKDRITKLVASLESIEGNTL